MKKIIEFLVKYASSFTLGVVAALLVANALHLEMPPWFRAEKATSRTEPAPLPSELTWCDKLGEVRDDGHTQLRCDEGSHVWTRPPISPPASLKEIVQPKNSVMIKTNDPTTVYIRPFCQFGLQFTAATQFNRENHRGSGGLVITQVMEASNPPKPMKCKEEN